MSDTQDDFSDLASFDGDYRPENAFTAGLDSLSDGDYDFTIERAELRTVEGARICEWLLRPAGGAAVRHTYWLNRQNGMNALGSDLSILGFDADRWGSGPGKISLQTALPDAIRRLPGKRFRARKTSRKGTGDYADRTFHELHINAPLPSTSVKTPPLPMPTPTFTAPADDLPF